MPGFLRFKGKGRPARRVPGQMNGLERAYAAHLEARKLAGEVADYKFELIKLRIAKRTYITIDFAVMLADGTVEFHEVKSSYMEDDAAVKLKAIAEQLWWFRFVLVRKRLKKHGGGFAYFPIGD